MNITATTTPRFRRGLTLVEVTNPMTHSNEDSARLAAMEVAAAQAGPGYETRDTNIAAIIIFLIALFASLFVIQVALWFMFQEVIDETGVVTIPAADAAPSQAFQYPMTSALHEQLNTLRDSERLILNDSSWVEDGGKKVVRIPIHQAISVLTDRGIPTYSGKPQTESMVNSHSGVAQPMDEKGKLKPDDKAKPDGGAKP